MSLLVAPLHKGWHSVAGAQPFASNAYSFPSNDPMYTTPFTTAGEEESTRSPINPCQASLREVALVLLMVFSRGLKPMRSEEHTSELQSRQYLHSFPTRRSSDLTKVGTP